MSRNTKFHLKEKLHSIYTPSTDKIKINLKNHDLTEKILAENIIELVRNISDKEVKKLNQKIKKYTLYLNRQALLKTKVLL